MKRTRILLVMILMTVPLLAQAEGSSAPKGEEVIVTTSLEIVR